MVECHHRLNGHEFTPTPGDSEGQGILACDSLCSCKEWNVTYGLNSNDSNKFLRASLVVQMVKNLSVMQETQAQPLGREDPLEKEIATHSTILA